jgi:hypothetical protein
VSSSTPAALAMGLLVLAVVVELLRRRHLREKYAATWIVVCCVTVVLAISPPVLTGLTRALGFVVPANLLFYLASLVLTVITMHLSLEIGRLEDKTQRLAEEVALARLDLDRGSVTRPPTSPPADPRERPATPPQLGVDE